MELLLLLLQAHAVPPEPPPTMVQPWHIYTVLGGVIGTLGTYIKILHATKDKQIAKLAADKDALIAAKDKKIDELNDERVKYAEKMIATMQAARNAPRGGRPDA